MLSRNTSKKEETKEQTIKTKQKKKLSATEVDQFHLHFTFSARTCVKGEKKQ